MQKNRLIEKYMSLLFEEIPLSPKLELCRASQIRLGISDLNYVEIDGRKAGEGFSQPAPNILYCPRQSKILATAMFVLDNYKYTI